MTSPLEQLKAIGDPARAADMARYHKAPRTYLGIANPDTYELVAKWRHDCGTLEERVALADTLWQSDIFEARVAATKLLTQARIKDDGPVWELICRWVQDFDSWAIADHASNAGGRRLNADTSRLDTVEGWTTSENMWVRRAALVMTLGWAKMAHPKPEQLEERERILGWAASYVPDHNWFIQKAIGWWLRTLSRHDPERVQAFIDENGAGMKPFAVREAVKYLPKTD